MLRNIGLVVDFVFMGCLIEIIFVKVLVLCDFKIVVFSVNEIYCWFYLYSNFFLKN